MCCNLTDLSSYRCANPFSEVLDLPLKDNLKPLVVYVELPMLPTARSERVAQLAENGLSHDNSIIFESS